MNPAVVRYRDEYGTAALLVVREGRTLLHAVRIDGSVKIVKLPLAELRNMQPLSRRGVDYPPKQAARRFLAAGRSLGISKSARVVLREMVAA